jgi:hypothetical protein
MSMMTSMLCVAEKWLKQLMHLENISLFETKFVPIVGNLAQLLPIYKHTIWNNDILCKSCQNNKTTFLIHAIDLEYLQFHNNMWERKPTSKEIQTILSQCFLNK